METCGDESLFAKKSFSLEIKETHTLKALLCPRPMLATFTHIISFNPQRSLEAYFIDEDTDLEM